MAKNNLLPTDYLAFIEGLKGHIAKARVKAALSVNKELILMYWEIGGMILDGQLKQGWGSKVIENISKDLRKSFPDMKGLGVANLHNMRRFAELYKEKSILQQAVGEIPWGHNIVLMEKIRDKNQRLWYIKKTIEHGWSRNVLALQISSNLYAREGKALTNFKTTLPSPQSELAHQLLKDPYNLEFISANHDAHEREIEGMLVLKIKDFLLELGTGFAFVGSQYHLQVDNEDYFLDLLFYHVKLKRYIIVELKTGKFKPEYAGKLNFYLSLVDKQLKDHIDNPAIGIILCREHHKLTVEYSLETINRPLGVSTYTLTTELPKTLKKVLPTPKELSAQLNTRIKEKGC